MAVGTSMMGCGPKEDSPLDTENNTPVENVTDGAIDSDEEDDEVLDSDEIKGDDSSEQNPADKPTGGNTANKPNGTDKPGTGAQKPGSGSNKPSSGGSATLTKSLEDTISGLYTASGITDIKTGNTSINAENMAYYLGVDNIKIKQGLASEPLMSSMAHSIVLIELESGQDVSKIKTSIKNNVNGYKWVCVGVEPENILVDNIGNFVLLVMDEEAQLFMDAFKALAK